MTRTIVAGLTLGATAAAAATASASRGAAPTEVAASRAVGTGSTAARETEAMHADDLSGEVAAQNESVSWPVAFSKAAAPGLVKRGRPSP